MHHHYFQVFQALDKILLFLPNLQPQSYCITPLFQCCLFSDIQERSSVWSNSNSSSILFYHRISLNFVIFSFIKKLRLIISKLKLSGQNHFRWLAMKWKRNVFKNILKNVASLFFSLWFIFLQETLLFGIQETTKDL